MRIGIITANFSPSGESGGVGRHIKDLSDFLTKKGNKVYFLTDKKRDLSGREDKGNLVINRFSPLFPARWQKAIFCDPYSLYQTIQFIKRHRPDILHLHRFVDFSLSPIIAARLCRTPVIVTVHNRWTICLLNRFAYHTGGPCNGYDKRECAICLNNALFEAYGVWFSSLFIRRALEVVFCFRKIILKAVACFIVPSLVVKKDLMSLGVSEEKIDYIPHGVSFGRQEDKEYPLSEDKVVLFVGRLAKEKGLEYLVHAFVLVLKKIPAAKLVLAGEGPERERLEHLAKEEGLGEKIDFPGQVSRSHLPALFSQARLCVLPSLSETFPYGALEAMAFGKPLIASDVGGLKELVRKENGLLVKPGSVQDLADALVKILSSDSLAQEMGRAAKRIVKNEYSLEWKNKSTIAVYKKVKKDERN